MCLYCIQLLQTSSYQQGISYNTSQMLDVNQSNWIWFMRRRGTDLDDHPKSMTLLAVKSYYRGPLNHRHLGRDFINLRRRHLK